MQRYTVMYTNPVKYMMDWMQGFGSRFDSDEILNEKNNWKILIWLDEQEGKVKALREQINSSIENAEKILGKEEYYPEKAYSFHFKLSMIFLISFCK